MKHSERLMSERQFEYACLRLRPKANMRGAVLDYMVRGLSLGEVCDKHGVHKQNLLRKCKEFIDVVVPDGWEFKMIALPPDIMREVEQRSYDLLPDEFK